MRSDRAENLNIIVTTAEVYVILYFAQTTTRSGGIMSFRNISKLFVSALVLIFAAALVSCGGSKGDDYKIISPVVDPGTVLSGEDFIITSAFTRSEYDVTINEAAPTDEPGPHDVSVTVTDGHGFERTHRCTYTVRSYLRDSVRIEIGNPVTVEKFINTDIDSYRGRVFEFDDPLTVASYGIGTYKIGILVDGMLEYSSLILEDTTPPVASPVTVHITAQTGTPRAEDFVADIKDATSVACTFKEEYDFNTTVDVPVVIILTDEAGNTAEISSLATCAVDTIAPEIHGVRDITAYVGTSPKYRDGITVTDDSGEVPHLEVDVSRVNTNVIGSYEITYSASDTSGNKTVVHATVYIVEKPKVTEADVEKLAKEIYDGSIHTSGDMTKWDIAYAIFKWTRDRISASDTPYDTTDPTGAAYAGLLDRTGDSFVRMCAARALLNTAGISNRQIERLIYSGESAHYWLLVDIGDGFYHFDPTPTGRSYEPFMRTDAELDAYCTQYNIEYYYRYDRSKYPTRGSSSYYKDGGDD